MYQNTVGEIGTVKGNPQAHSYRKLFQQISQKWLHEQMTKNQRRALSMRKPSNVSSIKENSTLSPSLEKSEDITIMSEK